uniref:DUF6598 domain-containing protein n=1 Tax=Leersia perrieri TaxID=77586 RepID=A0A0D9X272_9ORYZ
MAHAIQRFSVIPPATGASATAARLDARLLRPEHLTSPAPIDDAPTFSFHDHGGGISRIIASLVEVVVVIVAHTRRSFFTDHDVSQSTRPSFFPENIHSTITKGFEKIDNRSTISSAIIAGDEKNYKDDCKAAPEGLYVKYDVLHNGCNEENKRSKTDEHKRGFFVSDDEGIDDEECTKDETVLPDSTHHNGSMYNMDIWWKKQYHIEDRNETQLEAMALSDPTNCITQGFCTHHHIALMQIVSLKLVKIPVDCSSVELYGYIAVRDDLDTLLNYIGSLINMTGPKRAIEMLDLRLIEYDMRIKTGNKKKMIYS